MDDNAVLLWVRIASVVEVLGLAFVHAYYRAKDGAGRSVPPASGRSWSYVDVDRPGPGGADADRPGGGRLGDRGSPGWDIGGSADQVLRPRGAADSGVPPPAPAPGDDDQRSARQRTDALEDRDEPGVD